MIFPLLTRKCFYFLSVFEIVIKWILKKDLTERKTIISSILKGVGIISLNYFNKVRLW